MTAQTVGTRNTTASTLLGIIKATILLDPLDAYYAASSEKLSRSYFAAERRTGSANRRGGSLLLWARFLGMTVRSMWSPVVVDPPRWPSSVLLIAVTANQTVALEPLARELGKDGHSVSFLRPEGPDGDVRYVSRYAHAAAIPFFPFLVARWFRARGYARRSFRWAFDQYWLAYGLHFVTSIHLARQRPSVVVLANDHALWPRVIQKAASALGIRTAYLQHAVVTENFPPLDFDIALLDGVDAVEKYRKAGVSKCEVYVVGMCKADGYINPAGGAAPLGRLAICLNRHDPFERVELVLKELVSIAGLEVAVRPHPSAPGADKQRLRRFGQRCGAGYSDPAVEDPFTFLSRHQALIAGDSSIHLEAALLGLTPLYVDFDGSGADWYGFVRNGLCIHVDSLEKLRGVVSRLMVARESSRDAAARYCGSLNTEWEGRSAALAAEIIASFGSQELVATDGATAEWKPPKRALALSLNDSA